jgi:hypothetical protein
VTDDDTVHRHPSVGSLVKKVVEINPGLTTAEIIKMVRMSVRKLGDPAGEFSSAEIVDEQKVLELARLTLKK